MRETLSADATEAAWIEQLERIANRIQRLGPINLAAIEEFESSSERKQYLDQQHGDLTEALETLGNAIRPGGRLAIDTGCAAESILPTLLKQRWHRLDDIIVFRSLTKPDLIQILDLEIKKVVGRLKGKNLHLTLDEKAKDFLVEKGYDPTYGARPMRRAVERYLEDPLAEEILKGNLHDHDPVFATLGTDKLLFEQRAPAAGALTG